MVDQSKAAGLLDTIAKMITDGEPHQPRAQRLPVNRKHFRIGNVKPIIDSVYNFDDVLSAYDKILTGHARGKVVVEIS